MHAGNERVETLAQQNDIMEAGIKEMDAMMASFRAEIQALERSNKEINCFERQIAHFKDQENLSTAKVEKVRGIRFTVST